MLICFLFLQVDELKIELEVKQKEKEALEAQTIEFERRLTELNLKLENVGFLAFPFSTCYVRNQNIEIGRAHV